MDEPTDPELIKLKSKLGPGAWARRVAEAERQAEICTRLVADEADGTPLGRSIRRLGEGEADATWRDRVDRYRRGGVEGLIDRRYIAGEEKVTREVMAFVRGLKAGSPELSSREVAAAVTAQLGVPIAASTLRPFLQEAGLARPEGRPPRARAEVVPLGLAGAELLKAAAQEAGVFAALADTVSRALGRLPAPEPGKVQDDVANRDRHGRFLGGYNAAQGRSGGELGPRFRSVSERREYKALPNMQIAKVRRRTLLRKIQALVLLPCVIPTPRWDGLQHWQGEHLGPLVGFAYQAATLDKFLRELKYAGAATAVRDAVAAFWTRSEATADADAGAILLYADTATKPVWTHHFGRCVPVAKLGGRIMPATSTITIHTGCGTPVLYRAFSGHVSLPAQVPSLLREYEDVAGPGSAERVIVIDREAHSVALFKELAAANWSYIIPLCSNVTGPKAVFEEVSAWEPYGETGDEVCEARLLLRDQRPSEDDLRVRVVGRRRRRTGKVAWYATNTSRKLFDAPTVVQHYFARWPLQEHVFRDGNGRIGLDVHHGFGRVKVQNVAVVGAIEKVDGRLRALASTLADTQTKHAAAHDLVVRFNAIKDGVVTARRALRDDLARRTRSQSSTHAEIAEDMERLRSLEEWIEDQVALGRRLVEAERRLDTRVHRLTAAEERARIERRSLLARREVYTIDVELDEIMTGLKLTFMNLCRYFVRTYLRDEHVESDTLLQAVFSLPGERVRTRTQDTIRIWRQPRERRFMPLVEHACAELTRKGLRAGARRLVFEVADPPHQPKGGAPATRLG